MIKNIDRVAMFSFLIPVLFFCSLLNAEAAKQDNKDDWFVPKPASQTAVPTARSAPSSKSAQLAPAPHDSEQIPDDEGKSLPDGPPVLPLPPIPKPQSLAKTFPPPRPVVGVISVPEIMRQSTAADEIARVMGARRDELTRYAAKEQQSLRGSLAVIQSQSRNIPATQLQTKEKELQQQLLKSRKEIGNRNRIIQEAAQVALGQIERELVLIIRQVAESHSINLVLHREQVALSITDLDLTQEVADHLNSTLKKVFIPGPDVDPEELAKTGKMPTTANPGEAADQLPSDSVMPAGAAAPLIKR